MRHILSIAIGLLVALMILTGQIAVSVLTLLAVLAIIILLAVIARSTDDGGGRRAATLPTPAASTPVASPAVSDPRWTKVVGAPGMPAEAVVASARRLMAASAPWIVVEAVWLDAAHSSMGLAFGQPGMAYRRVWSWGEDAMRWLYAQTAEARPSA